MAVAHRRLSDYERERGKPVPSFNHGIIQAQLGAEFLPHPDYNVGSEITLDLGTPPNPTPDILVFKKAKLDLRRDKIRTTEPPVSVVEILSPTQGSFELMQRLDRYFEHGIRSCWVVYPTSASVTIYDADGTEKTWSEGVVEDTTTGLTADLDRVFS